MMKFKDIKNIKKINKAIAMKNYTCDNSQVRRSTVGGLTYDNIVIAPDMDVD